MGLAASERLGLDIKRAEQTLMAAKSCALRNAGVTVAQYAALATLADNPGISGAALARACLVTPQAITGVLKTLEQQGLVERATHQWHQRLLEIRLTDEGERILGIADHEAVRIEQRMRDALDEAERENLRDLLARVVDAIEEVES